MKTLAATIANSMGTWEIKLCEDGTVEVVKFDPAPVRPAMRGLGDVVAAVTSAVGIKPCGGCAKRQDTLNRAFPFQREAPVAGTPVSDSLGEASDPVPGQANASLPASAPQMPPEASDAAGGP